jgi:hypothetical protein
MINRGYLFAGIMFGGRVYADLRWQPFINLTTDTQSHSPLESNDDRYPFLLLDAAAAPPVVVPTWFAPQYPVQLRDWAMWDVAMSGLFPGPLQDP